MYTIERLAQLVVDAKNDNASLYLLCDHITAFFDYSIIILSVAAGKIRKRQTFAIAVGQEVCVKYLLA